MVCEFVMFDSVNAVFKMRGSRPSSSILLPKEKEEAGEAVQPTWCNQKVGGPSAIHPLPQGEGRGEGDI